MTALGPMSPDGVAYLLHQFRERLEYGGPQPDRVATVEAVWDDLARYGVAGPRPAPAQPCPEHCDDDAHYLTITRWDGSMHHTVHVDRLRIAELNDAEGPSALAAYRDRARASLLRVEPPGQPTPSREGTYVVTPPDAAQVSAPSVVEIIPGDRMTAMDEWRARQA